MSDKNKGLGDVITANTSEKVDYALGALSWHGWYLIVTGILEIFGLDRESRRNKKFAKHLKDTDYTIYFKRF